MNKEVLHAALAAHPGWESLSAFEMTKICCFEMTKLGLDVPGWIEIREIIGKGSSTDINRGKKAFKEEHGHLLRKYAGGLKGVPEVLAPHVLGLWQAAIEEVRKEFDLERSEWTRRIEQAEARAQHADDEREQAQTQAQLRDAQIAALQEKAASLQTVVDVERSGKEQAERMFAESRDAMTVQRQEMASQRQQMAEEVEKYRRDLDAAIGRLEGVENRALMRVEEVRAERQRTIEELEAKVKRVSEGATFAEHRFDKMLKEARAEKAAAEQQVTLLEAEMTQLQERLEKAVEVVPDPDVASAPVAPRRFARKGLVLKR